MRAKNSISEKRLRLAPCVTRRHGLIFAKIWLADSLRSEDSAEAFDLAEVIAYPSEDEDDTPAKIRYGLLFDEIVRRTFDALKRPAVDAFVKFATEVVERERERQKISRRLAPEDQERR